MNDEQQLNTRRSALLTVGTGLGVGLAAAGAALKASAQSATASADSRVGEAISQEFWAHKGGVKLWVYRKQLSGGAAKKPLLFLVHGSSYSAKTMFD